MSHKVRTRTDSAETNVLRPAAQRLRKFEGDLRENRRKILAMVRDDLLLLHRLACQEAFAKIAIDVYDGGCHAAYSFRIASR